MDQLPALCTEVPGPRSRAMAARLAKVECPEVTTLDPLPIFYASGAGANVIDVDGNRYVDLLAGFGVMALGYAHPAVTAAAKGQLERLPHALGDVYPAAEKLELLERLRALLPGDLGLGILSSSGSDAIESALKTALIATGRPDVVAFEGAYHGLGLGALDVTHRADLREPFRARLAGRTHFVAYGDADAARSAVRRSRAGAIVVEPIQGRGGLRIPDDDFLRELRAIADAEGALLIVDEIYTGLGRTGSWLACEQAGVTPDLVTLGKALGAGLPLSVCLGREDVMRRWPSARGEALHTSTHLGNPTTCATGRAVLDALDQGGLAERARALGARALERLRERLVGVDAVADVRGRGLMIGVELRSAAHARAVVRSALERGWILLAEGPSANVLSLTPPLTIDEGVLEAGIDAIAELASSARPAAGVA